ncbi:hypothetical protein BB561_002044 [Smittium simulii]|uniref:GTP cyclohydrolase II n=1 Tax=Smittium simulii TaxID=133385 RepID=A0A2T9YRV7_9FUNG|nr:hypothetical protein BB561_002044 [Smittium simulii]
MDTSSISSTSTLPENKLHSLPESPLASPSIVCKVRARIPYPGGSFYLHLYTNNMDTKEHLAIVFGDEITSLSLNEPRENETEMDRKVRGAAPLQNNLSDTPKTLSKAPVVRIHSECYTGETVSSTRCDCGYQLAESMRLMSLQKSGVVVYLRQEGRNIGLLEKLKAYNLQDMGHDTVTANLILNHPADGRTYEMAQLILKDFSINKMQLLTNNPDKVEKITENSDIVVESRLPMLPSWWIDPSHADHCETLHGIDACPTPINDLATDIDTTVENTPEYLENSLNKAKSVSPAAFSSYERHIRPTKPTMSEADKYLITKALKMGHLLDIPKF